MTIASTPSIPRPPGCGQSAAAPLEDSQEPQRAPICHARRWNLGQRSVGSRSRVSPPSFWLPGRSRRRAETARGVNRLPYRPTDRPTARRWRPTWTSERPAESCAYWTHAPDSRPGSSILNTSPLSEADSTPATAKDHRFCARGYVPSRGRRSTQASSLEPILRRFPRRNPSRFDGRRSVDVTCRVSPKDAP